MDHLLLHCEVSCALWSVVGLPWVMLSLVDLFACWRGLYGSPQSAVVQKIVSSRLLWCLWKERINKSFEDHERTMVEFKFFFFKTLYLWTIRFAFPNLLTFHDFVGFFFFFLFFQISVSLVYFLYTWIVIFVF
jgi:hypothetical protein